MDLRDMPTNNGARSRKFPGPGVVAVMGMTKNTGKTVALNHLLARAAADHVAVGLTSIGRDGEDRDAVFSIPKPPVLAWPGTLVATVTASDPDAGEVLFRVTDALGDHRDAFRADVLGDRAGRALLTLAPEDIAEARLALLLRI